MLGSSIVFLKFVPLCSGGRGAFYRQSGVVVVENAFELGFAENFLETCQQLGWAGSHHCPPLIRYTRDPCYLL